MGVRVRVMFNQIENYMSNVDEVMALIKKYDHLFKAEEPGKSGDIMEDLNPNSVEVISGCKLEPALEQCETSKAVQFERLGYFIVDKGSTSAEPVFNRTMTLRDTWAKVQKKGG